MSKLTASEMGERDRIAMEEPDIWHLLAGNTGEQSRGMCGQAVEDNHSATTVLENVRCIPCLVAEIREARENMRLIVKICQGEEL